MKKIINNIRKILAIIIGKMVIFLLTKIKGKTSFYGGKVALKIYPELFESLQMPEKIICVTGTNGKTSVTNMIIDVLEQNNIKLVSNKSGANLKTGIVNSFLTMSTLTGKTKAKLGVFEIDERVSPLIYKFLKPDYLVITNIARDSMKRNANTDYISYILESSIPSNTKIIVNGDDIIASRITNNSKVYYGIEKQEFENLKAKPFNISLDISTCNITNNSLEYEFVRMNHQGRLKEDNINVKTKSPKLDYVIKNIDKENKEITVVNNNKEIKYHLVQDTMFNVYNELAAISLLSEVNNDIVLFENNKINESLKNIKITKSRYTNHILKNGKILIKNLAKGQNPIACSTVFKSVRDDESKKDIIMMLADRDDNKEASETMMWIYEMDMEFLNDKNINNIYLLGPRQEDFKVRMKMADIQDEKIHMIGNNKENITEKEYTNILNMLEKNYSNLDKIYILNDMYMEKEASAIYEYIVNKFK